MQPRAAWPPRGVAERQAHPADRDPARVQRRAHSGAARRASLGRSAGNSRHSCWGRWGLGSKAHRVFEDADALATAVADEFIRADRRSHPHAPFTVAPPRAARRRRSSYELLVSEPYRERVRWKDVEFFFGDERSVPPDHPDSNYGMAKRALLDHVPSPRAPHGRRDGTTRDGYARLLGERIAEPARRDAGARPRAARHRRGRPHGVALPGTAALAERDALGRDERRARSCTRDA